MSFSLPTLFQKSSYATEQLKTYLLKNAKDTGHVSDKVSSLKYVLHVNSEYNLDK